MMNLLRESNPLLRGLAASVVMMAVSACGGSQDYPVPDEVCDRKVDPELLAPLLPPGEKIEIDESTLSSGTLRCLIRVDGEIELSIREYPNGGKFDALEFTRGRSDRFRNPSEVDIGGQTVVSDGMVISLNSCIRQGIRNDYILEISVDRFDPENPQSWRKELERFTRAYLPMGMKEMACSE